jgi:NIMA (never in mitosis gene a)-related kinase
LRGLLNPLSPLLCLLSSLLPLHRSYLCHQVGDLNVSKKMGAGLLHTQIGTPYYMSPEIWANRPYDAGCDMWALGCTLYELAALRPPFVGDSFPALKKNIAAGK